LVDEVEISPWLVFWTGFRLRQIPKMRRQLKSQI
jgi:hypothetical protein